MDVGGFAREWDGCSDGLKGRRRLSGKGFIFRMIGIIRCGSCMDA